MYIPVARTALHALRDEAGGADGAPRVEVSSIGDGGPLRAAYGHETVGAAGDHEEPMARLQPLQLTRNRAALMLSLPIALLGLTGLDLPGPAASSAAHHACDRYAAPQGSD